MAKKKGNGKNTPKRKYTRKLPTATELNQQLQILSAEKQSYMEKAEELHAINNKQSNEIIELKNALKTNEVSVPDNTDLVLALDKIKKMEVRLEKSVLDIADAERRTRIHAGTAKEYSDRYTKLEKRINAFNAGSFWHRFITEAGHV